MVAVMPQVLSEILGYWSTREEVIPAATEESTVPFSAAGTDLESGGNGQGNTSSSDQQHGEQPEACKLQSALNELCRIISERWCGKDPDVRTQLDEIAAKICLEQQKPVKDFQALMKEAKEKF
ncbi:hypothetical protein ACP4OV_023272 [Aristida adscensionis]